MSAAQLPEPESKAGCCLEAREEPSSTATPAISPSPPSPRRAHPAGLCSLSRLSLKSGGGGGGFREEQRGFLAVTVTPRDEETLWNF